MPDRRTLLNVLGNQSGEGALEAGELAPVSSKRLRPVSTASANQYVLPVHPVGTHVPP